MLRKRQVSTFLNKMAWSIVIWICAALLFGYIRVWGVESLPSFERVLPFQPLFFPFYMIVFGLAIGIPFGIMDFVLDTDWIRKHSYWRIIIIKVAIQLIIAVFSIALLATLNNRLDESKIGIIRFIFSETSYMWIVFTSIVSFFIYFLEVMKTKIGDRVMFNLIMGKYHNPRVETRIFMFLDMKDSTTHAENLGHIKFSSLIQDSLNDLTPAIIEHKVEVYQYVGDEAVLTWN